MKNKTVQHNQKWIQRTKAVIICTAAALLCMGCGGTFGESDGASTGRLSADSISSAPAAGGNMYNGTNASYDENSTVFNGTMGEEEVKEDTSGVLDARKLITNVKLELETKEFEQTMSGIEVQIRELGGYIESMETYNGSNYTGNRSSRYSNMIIRIPAAKLNGFMDVVAEAGNIIRRNDDVKDVTLSYVDMESRRDTLRTEQSRLLEFLERADSVETVIALEERLSEVRYQLESMESQLRTIDNLVDYSTVNLQVNEVKELTPVVEQTAWERMETGFWDSILDIKNGIVEAVILFIVNSPYIMIRVLAIAAIILILRRFGRRQEKKKKEQQIGKQTGGQTDGQSSREPNRQMNEQVNREPNGQTNEQGEQTSK